MECSFAGFAPIASHLRLQLCERWVRVHSLPESQRYANTPDEYRELLSRQNTLATALFGEHGAVTLVIGAFRWMDERRTRPVTAFADAPVLEFVRTVDPRELVAHADPADDAWIDLYTATVQWNAGAFDELLRSVADDRERLVMFVSADGTRAFGPYDGGVDVFLESTLVRDAWKVRYATWLSRTESGL